MTDALTKVGVWLGADQAGLRLPSRAITDGSPAPVSVEARPFTYRFRRLRVTLPVDAATAHRIVRADRWTLVGAMLALGYLVYALAMLVLLIVAVLSQRWLLVAVLTPLVALPGVGLAIVPQFIAHSLRPAQYPQVKPGGRMLIGAVDRVAANEWVALNPPGTIEVTRP